jgi:cycloeucalenol cycloisomerase
MAAPRGTASPFGRKVGQTRWLSQDPSKRWAERFVLAYSPVWMLTVALLQVTGWMGGMADVGHLALGVGLAAPLWLLPLVRPGAADRARPVAERYITSFNVWILAFTLLQVYFGSALFFDFLGMEYHFHVTWTVNRTPLFLYPMTVAYFSTYYVVLQILWRAFATRVPAAPALARYAVLAALSYAVAFAETSSMATEMMRPYFLYRDRTFTLIYGSLCYGTVFFVSLPGFARIGEPGAERRTPWRLVWDACAANTLVLVCYALYAALITRRV